MAKNGQNGVFYLYVQNSAMNFYNFWYGNSPCVLIWENHIVYMPGIPDMDKIWSFVAKVFGQNWQFESLWPITLKRCYESSFLYGIFSYGLLWENHSLYAGKILIWRNFDHLSHFWPKLTVLRVSAYNFQTPLWILLSFGMEVVLLVFFEKSYCIYQENSDMAKLWAFNKAKIWSFLSEIDRFESFWSITSKRRYESS